MNRPWNRSMAARSRSVTGTPNESITRFNRARIARRSASRSGGHPTTAQDTEAKCRAYDQVGGNGKALDSTAWQRLVTAAGGADRVAAYCAEQLAQAAKAEPTRSEPTKSGATRPAGATQPGATRTGPTKTAGGGATGDGQGSSGKNTSGEGTGKPEKAEEKN